MPDARDRLAEKGTVDLLAALQQSLVKMRSDRPVSTDPSTDPSVADDPLFSIPLSRLNELSARGAKLREIENALREPSDELVERLVDPLFVHDDWSHAYDGNEIVGAKCGCGHLEPNGEAWVGHRVRAVLAVLDDEFGVTR